MEYELQLGKNGTLEEYMPAYTTFGAPASATAIPTYTIYISRDIHRDILRWDINHLPSSSHSKYTIHHAIISSHLRQRSMYIINAIFSRNQ